jgi:hypothetical protein
MHDIRIKIARAKLESYWYANKIGEVYWAMLDNQYDDGVNGWVAIDDCCALPDA